MTIPADAASEDFSADGTTAEAGVDAPLLTLPGTGILCAADLDEACVLPTSVATRYPALSDDVDDVVVLAHTGKVDAAPPGTAERNALPNTGDVPAERIEPAAAEASSSTPDPAQTASDGRSDPVPEPTGEGLAPIWLYDDIELKIWPEERDRFPVEFLRAGKRLRLMETRGEPWLSVRLQDRIAAALGRALGDCARKPDFIRAKVQAAFEEIKKTVEENPKDKDALTSRPIRFVLAKTDAVEIFPSSEPKGTLFVIALGNQALTMTAQEMAARDPRALNTAWMSMFYEPLNATAKDWRRIQAIWTDPELRTIHDREEITEVESIIERLRADLEGITLVATLKELVGDNVGWCDESCNRVWVRNTRISRFIDQDLKRPLGYASLLSKHLRTAGHMPTTSKRMRAGPSSVIVGVWGFTREFAWSTATPTPPPLTVADAFEARARREHP